jgi:Transposase DDE domain group 1
MAAELTGLRRSNIDASAGAVAEVERIVRQIRARWPEVRLALRADSGFAREALMAWCEANRVDYALGLARNTRLVTGIAAELALSALPTSRRGIGPEARWPRLRQSKPASRPAALETAATRRWTVGAARAGWSALRGLLPAPASRIGSSVA